MNTVDAPDNFFDSDRRPILIRDFIGKTNLTEKQAIALVRQTLAKLNYPTNLVHINFKPEVHNPTVPGIPRYYFQWFYYPEGPDQPLQSKVEAEVNADNGKLESLYYDDKTYWGHPPPIDVPISASKP